MMKFRTLIFAAMAAIVMVVAAPAWAQNQASVHGHVNDATGVAVTGAAVSFTTDKSSEPKDRKYPYSFQTDGNGDYKATGVPPGDYLVVIIKGGVNMDYQSLTLKAGDDKTLDFDMTRAEYINSLTPELRKQIEETKKKNSEAISANQVIAKLNATLKTVRADLAAATPTKADVSTDVASMKDATAAKPDSGLLWITYGDTLLAQADHLAAADKAAGKPAMSDDDVLKEYGAAADSYKKGLDLDNAAAKPNTTEIAAGYNQMGVALSRSGKLNDASAAFDGAVKVDPTKAGMYYKNEAVILFNANQNDAALVAANKAIAADPNGADPYWIKGQVLIAQSTFDAKTQKLTPPPGCVDAYDKFLELAPNDPKADGVREVLTSLGEKIDTKYRATKK
jgi:tetratricopeptide (TPR) repeat protein